MIETKRLVLRPWRDEDGPAFARVTKTPAVMAHLGGVAPADRFADLAGSQRAIEAEHGFCFWVVERRSDRTLLGFCGLEPVTTAGTPVTGETEIGWRLREDAWGQGFGQEAAAATLA